jgi:hypothetical protein
MPGADCHQNAATGPVCTWIDGAPPTEDLLLCRGVLCPPEIKCFLGDCIVPGTGLPYSDCDSGADCPINAGCLPLTEEGFDASCTWFCQDFPCPVGYECNESIFENTSTGQLVTHLICEPLPSDGEGTGETCQPDSCPECEDKVDDDGDGFIDCADEGCADYCSGHGQFSEKR